MLYYYDYHWTSYCYCSYTTSDTAAGCLPLAMPRAVLRRHVPELPAGQETDLARRIARWLPVLRVA